MSHFSIKTAYFEQIQLLNECLLALKTFRGQLAAEPLLSEVPEQIDDLHGWISDMIPRLTGSIDDGVGLQGTPASSLAVDFQGFASRAGAIAASLPLGSEAFDIGTPETDEAIALQKNDALDLMLVMISKIETAIQLLKLPKTDLAAAKAYMNTRKVSFPRYKVGVRVVVKSNGKRGRVLSMRRHGGYGKTYYSVKLDDADRPKEYGTNELVKE